MLTARKGIVYYCWLSIPAIISIVIYYPSMQIWSIADDFDHLAMLANIATRWQVCNPPSFVFRPIERYINAINGYLAGYESMIITHAAAIAIFALMALLMYYICRRVLSISRSASSLTAILISVLPANAMSITQIDTISQLCASFFALVLLIHLHSVYRDENGCELWRVALTFVLSLLTLFSKETAIGIVTILPLIALLFCTPAPDSRNRARLFIHWSAAGAALILYFVLRAIVGATHNIAASDYAIPVALLMIGKNIIQLLFAAAYAGSTIDMFPHVQFWRIGVSFVFTVGLASMVLFLLFPGQPCSASSPAPEFSFRGLWFCSKFRKKILLIVIMLAGTFPVCVIDKMSELYAFSLIPFYCFLIGISIDEIINRLDVQHSRAVATRLKFVFGIFFLVMTVWLGFFAREKVLLTCQTSDMSQTFYHTAREFVKVLGDQQAVVCWQYAGEKMPEPSYSSFVMPPRMVLKGVFSFCNDFHHSRITYIEHPQDSLPCSWYASYQNGSLKITQGGY